MWKSDIISLTHILTIYSQYNNDIDSVTIILIYAVEFSIYYWFSLMIPSKLLNTDCIVPKLFSYVLCYVYPLHIPLEKLMGSVFTW